MRRRRFRPSFLAALAAIGCALAVLITLEFRAGTVEPASLAFAELELIHDLSVAAGDEFVVEVIGVADGETVRLYVDESYGPRTFSTVAENGAATFRIRPADGPGSGVVLLEASAPSGRGVSFLDITPGPAVNPIDLYLGPRTIEVGTGQIAMITAVPVDRLGNPVATATDVDFTVRRPDGDEESLSAQTSGLLAFIEVTSDTVTGRTRISANIDSARGPERIFDQVAALALPFELEVEGEPPPADGSSLVVLSTSRLVDRFGNQLPDGVIGYLDVAEDPGPLRLQSQVIDGRLHFVIEAPSVPSQVEFVASSSGAESDPLIVEFEPGAVEVPVEISETPTGTVVTVGRVIGPSGAFVPDGTVALVSSDGDVFEVPLELGQGSIVLPLGAQVTVSVLGIDGEIEDLR